MAQSDLGTRVGQYPLNAFGTLGQNAAFGTVSVHIGTGGMVVPTRNMATGIPTGLRTVYGSEGFGATLVGTGLYEITHPPANILRTFPQYVGPSGAGAMLTPQRSEGNSASGVVRIAAQSPVIASGAVAQPSGAFGYRPVQLPSGSRLDLLFLYNARNDQGLTQY